MEYKLSASILSADFANLGQELDDLHLAGIDSIHLDVMDNHYVPNLTFGPLLLKSLHKARPKVIFDLHIMAQPVDSLIESFAMAGANSITIHPDSTIHLDRSIATIKKANIKVGIALNPATPISELQYVLDDINSILVMSVNPGFGGQKFIAGAIEKIKDIKQLMQIRGVDIPIAVDGGINKTTIKTTRNAGASEFIIGSAIMDSGNYKKAIQEYRDALI